jgi:hypothetical protein
MAEEPCRAIGNGKLALHLAGGHSLFRFRHQVRGQKPFPERQVTIIENRAGRNGELIVARIAVVLRTALDRADFLRLATRAANALWPAQALKFFAGLVARRKLFDQFDEVHVVRYGLFN